MKVDFYHLAAGQLDAVLARIAGRLVDEGERLLVVSGDAGQRRALDQALWAIPPESFLPHAQAGAGEDADQPVLIAEAPVAVNAARNVALVDGIWREEALGFARAFHFFDDGSIDAARAAWRGLGAHDAVERRFWKQGEGGRWERAA